MSSFTRISLWLSIRRILAPRKLRNTYVALAIVTFVSAVALAAIKASMCAYSTETRTRDYPIICAASARKFVVVFQSISGYPSDLPDSSLKILFVTVDIALSLLLIAMPIHALRSMDLPRAKRNLLIMVFTGSIGTLVAALVHNVYVLRRNFRMNFFTTHYQAAIALIVCNIHVVIPRIYVIFTRRNDNDYVSTAASTSTTGRPRTTGTGPSNDTTTLMLTDVTHPIIDSTCDVTSSVFGGTPSIEGTEIVSTPGHVRTTL
ncbi:hypothetical protein AAF712_003822 [Marasmius tenuissimus]|uniref:Uncharacterized protein n=1 Tax=Marasmius tenuissimus TaxID=585030 RepID=A0ABR3A728_9AGAR